MGITTGALAGGAEVLVLGAVVVSGAWRQADLRGGSVERVEAVRSLNQQGLSSCLRRRNIADAWWLLR